MGKLRMASDVFRIQEHVLPCQYIRDYPRATLDGQEDTLSLAVKQYTPLDNLNPKPGDVTIIGAHANGFPKELYEPLWIELNARTSAAGFRIRSIWIADVAHQGQSSVLNEDKLGDDPSWFDHARDLLHMVNTFRSQMPRPLVGIGHSMGGAHLVHLSLMHPRLFETLVLIDPVLQAYTSSQGNVGPARSSAFRRDIWPSREAAAEAFKKNKFYQTWDPRVLDCWIKYGLRDLPTAIYPTMPPVKPTDIDKTTIPPTTVEPTVTAQPAPAVTLTTPKHQEVLTFLRPNYPPLDNPTAPGPHTVCESNLVAWHNPTHPDITPKEEPQQPLYRPESVILFNQLPNLRPSVLYIFGSESDLSYVDLRADKMRITGVGVGGSGGEPEGRVKEHLTMGAGHLIPMERVEETADQCVNWLAPELVRGRERDAANYKSWEGKSRRERQMIEPRFYEEVSKKFGSLPARKPRAGDAKL